MLYSFRHLSVGPLICFNLAHRAPLLARADKAINVLILSIPIVAVRVNLFYDYIIWHFFWQ